MSDRAAHPSAFAAYTVAECLAALDSDPGGLPAEEAALRRRAYGLNIPPQEIPEHWLHRLIRSFISPFNAILTGIAVLSLAVDFFSPSAGRHDYRTVFVVLFMVLLSSLLRFIQEHRSARAAEKLRRLVRSTASVRRPGMSPAEADM